MHKDLLMSWIRNVRAWKQNCALMQRAAWLEIKILFSTHRKNHCWLTWLCSFLCLQKAMPSHWKCHCKEKNQNKFHWHVTNIAFWMILLYIRSPLRRTCQILTKCLCCSAQTFLWSSEFAFCFLSCNSDQNTTPRVCQRTALYHLQASLNIPHDHGCFLMSRITFLPKQAKLHCTSTLEKSMSSLEDNYILSCLIVARLPGMIIW